MYSQHEEEVHICQLFESRPSGTFLDVGAFDGKTFSNTLRLVELGWKGVLVEPSPGPFRALLKLHSANPNLQLINAAVVPEVTVPLIPFYFTDDAVSTSSEAFHELWKTAINDYMKAYVVPLGAVELVDFCWSWFHQHDGQFPHFVNVDTEGTTLELVRELRRHLKPQAWCVEYAVGARSFQPEFVELLGTDYELCYTSPENLLFRRRLA